MVCLSCSKEDKYNLIRQGVDSDVVEFRSEKDFMQLRAYLIDRLNSKYGQMDQTYDKVSIVSKSFNIDFTAALKVRSQWVDYAEDMALYHISEEYHKLKASDNTAVFLGADYEYTPDDEDNIKIKIVLGQNKTGCERFNGIDEPFVVGDQAHFATGDGCFTALDEIAQSLVSKAVNCYHGAESPSPADDYVYVSDLIEIDLWDITTLNPRLNPDDDVAGDGIRDYTVMNLSYEYDGYYDDYSFYTYGSLNPLPQDAMCFPSESLNYYYGTHVDFIEEFRPFVSNNNPNIYNQALFLSMDCLYNATLCSGCDHNYNGYSDGWTGEATKYYYVILTYVSTPVREDILALRYDDEPMGP